MLLVGISPTATQPFDKHETKTHGKAIQYYNKLMIIQTKIQSRMTHLFTKCLTREKDQITSQEEK